MASYGFTLVESKHGVGSGGPSAWAKFNRGNRSFEFHFRFSLGSVSYSVESISENHKDFAWELGHNSTSYPTYEDSPVAQFEALIADI